MLLHCRGAFGEVRIVRERSSDRIMAMKKLKKSEMVRRGQVEHVRAERDVLAEVQNPYIVKLFYSFQVRNLSFKNNSHAHLSARFCENFLAPFIFWGVICSERLSVALGASDAVVLLPKDQCTVLINAQIVHQQALSINNSTPELTP